MAYADVKPNPPGVMKKNNRIAMEIDKHNRSWNGKEYTYRKHMVAKKMKQKGKESLEFAKSKTGKNEGNNLYEAKNEQERA